MLTRVDVVRLGSSHQVFDDALLALPLGGIGRYAARVPLTRACHIGDLSILVEAGGVSQSQQDTTRRPRELVTQRVSRALGGRETSAVRQERKDLSALLVDLVDGLDGI